jgi:hypothetical protein
MVSVVVLGLITTKAKRKLSVSVIGLTMQSYSLLYQGLGTFVTLAQIRAGQYKSYLILEFNSRAYWRFLPHFYSAKCF